MFKPTLMLKEKHRWSYMSDKALETRLGRITNLDKLDCFILMARRNNKPTLLTVAQARQRLLLDEPVAGPSTEREERITFDTNLDYPKPKTKSKPKIKKRVDGGNGRRILRRLDV